jgi:hypothetical protein
LTYERVILQAIVFMPKQTDARQVKVSGRPRFSRCIKTPIRMNKNIQGTIEKTDMVSVPATHHATIIVPPNGAFYAL